MTTSRRRPVVVAAAVAVVLLVVAGGWWAIRGLERPAPRCTAAALPAVGLAVDQADNAATVAAVGLAAGMPHHAVTVALATALQESGLRNLPGGDRDSAGLFQQRPSQGWGTYAEVTDPVAASRAFYTHLRQVPGWNTLDVTEAAQAVQHSAAPAAYAQWEPLARAVAAALTGEQPAALRCEGLDLRGPAGDAAALAQREFDGVRLRGPQPAARGWATATWLVAHAARLGVGQVRYDGRAWTADSGVWTANGPPDGELTWAYAT